LQGEEPLQAAARVADFLAWPGLNTEPKAPYPGQINKLHQRRQTMAGEHEDKQQVDQEQASSQEQAEADAGELAARIEEAVAAALAEQRDNVLRAQAEVQNMRRRCEQDVEKAHKFALERFSSDLLGVVDNLERALAAVPAEQGEQVKALCEGVELTLKGFLEVLGKYQIQPIAPQGEPFDPQQHQAVASVPSPQVEPNTVIDVMQKGYLLNGRVIRPAMVVVSKGA
jgi:molecular chaperone GrpE